ncbi:MAG: SoxR reducing system RseC family protein [candidate division WOR-3 bacterium]
MTKRVKSIIYQNIMEEKILGEVVEIKDGKIFIKIDMPSSCSSCSHSEECSIFQKDQNKIVECDNVSCEDVHTGDIVELKIEQKKILILSIVFYLVPALLIFLFSLGGYLLNKGEGFTALSGFFGFLLSLIFIFLFSKKKKHQFNHKIVRVLK